MFFIILMLLRIIFTICETNNCEAGFNEEPLFLFLLETAQKLIVLLSRVEKSKASFEPLRHNFEAEEG